MQNEKEQYIENNFKKITLYESQGGPRALSRFLDMLVEDEANETLQVSSSAGQKIHSVIVDALN